MANKNLFYSLYSHSQEKLNPGYVCSTAVDETAVSFDIQGSDGVITDSNGSTLSTIDLSAVHAAGLTQYNTETRIIQPYYQNIFRKQKIMKNIVMQNQMLFIIILHQRFSILQ